VEDLCFFVGSWCGVDEFDLGVGEVEGGFRYDVSVWVSVGCLVSVWW